MAEDHRRPIEPGGGLLDPGDLADGFGGFGMLVDHPDHQLLHRPGLIEPIGRGNQREDTGVRLRGVLDEDRGGQHDHSQIGAAVGARDLTQLAFDVAGRQLG